MMVYWEMQMSLKSLVDVSDKVGVLLLLTLNRLFGTETVTEEMSSVSFMSQIRSKLFSMSNW